MNIFSLLSIVVKRKYDTCVVFDLFVDKKKTFLWNWEATDKMCCLNDDSMRTKRKRKTFLSSKVSLWKCECYFWRNNRWMSSDTSRRRRQGRRRHSRKVRDHSSSDEFESIDLDPMPSQTTIPIPSIVQVWKKIIRKTIVRNSCLSKRNESIDRSALIEIIRTKERKDWWVIQSLKSCRIESWYHRAKLVASVDEHQIKKVRIMNDRQR